MSEEVTDACYLLSGEKLLGWILEAAGSSYWINVLYVQVTMHRDKVRIKQPTRCIKYPKFILSYNSTCFGHLPCPSSRVICCTHGNWYVSCGPCDRFLSARKRSHNLHETYQLPCVQQITPDDGHRRCPKRRVL
jgi:hypothetical protein